MSGYRDETETLRRRVAALESELRAARDEADALIVERDDVAGRLVAREAQYAASPPTREWSRAFVPLLGVVFSLGLTVALLAAAGFPAALAALFGAGGVLFYEWQRKKSEAASEERDREHERHAEREREERYRKRRKRRR